MYFYTQRVLCIVKKKWLSCDRKKSRETNIYPYANNYVNKFARPVHICANIYTFAALLGFLEKKHYQVYLPNLKVVPLQIKNCKEMLALKVYGMLDLYFASE